MVMILLVGLVAGLASALLFATLASGSVLSIALFYAAPLPILIAAMGWTHFAGLVAAIVAAAGLAAAFNPIFFTAFLFGVGLPAWWLGYLTLLARSEPAAPGGLEWYAIGRVVLWAAVAAAGAVTIAALAFGTDVETYRAALRTTIEQVLRAQTGTPAGDALVLPGGADPAAMIDILVSILPPTAAVLSMLTMLLNLYLAARVLAASGRLQRPWPDLAALDLPPLAVPLLAATIAGGFLPGLVGLFAGLFAATLTLAFALLGLAVCHHVTRGQGARGLVLASIYGALLVFGWPLIVLAGLGVGEVLFQLRARFAARRGPPAANDR